MQSDDLQTIVKRMIAAGQSDEDIALVISKFDSVAPKPEKPKERQSGLATLGDFVIGALKGGGETAVNLGSMLHKIPGVSGLVDSLYGQEGLSQASFPAAREALAPTNTAQSIGKGAEQFAELLAGGGVVSGATRGLRTGARILSEGVAGAGMNAAQGQSATAGGVMGAAMPAAGAAFRGARTLLRGAGANPVVRDAVEWGVRQGIPVDAATASGAPIVRAIQGAADATPLGGVVASQARNQADQALTGVGRQLAGRVNQQMGGNSLRGTGMVAGPPQTMVSAGESIQGRLGQLVKESSDEADGAYTKLREIESVSTTMVPGKVAPNVIMEDGTRTTGHFLEAVPMAVNVKTVRERLAPIYQRMMRSAQLAQPMGAEARALKSIDRLMTSEGDYLSLSVVDDALGDLKSALRSAPDQLGKGAGALKSTVAILDQHVIEAAKRAGPEAVAALEQGRKATIRKYVAADIAEGLGSEPAKVAGKLTARADTAVQSLRELSKVAPDELPKVGRAVIDDLLEKATQEGGFSKAQGIYADWQRLGEQTKSLLFTPDAKRDLDRFFLLAKRMGESPNPSMSGTIAMTGGSTALAFTNPATGVPLVLGAGALSKLLHSPAGVKLVTQAMAMPKTAPGYPGILSRLSRAAGLEMSQAGGQ